MAVDQPACAHLYVERVTRHHEGGSCSDSWPCRDCGQAFAPVSVTDYDPRAMLRAALVANPDRAVAHRPDGTPVFAPDMIVLLDRDDPAARGFLEDIVGATLRACRVRTATWLVQDTDALPGMPGGWATRPPHSPGQRCPVHELCPACARIARAALVAATQCIEVPRA